MPRFLRRLLLGLSLICALNAARSASAQPESSPASAPEGRTIYQNRCAACHGADGRGNGPRSRNLHVSPRNLADCDRMGMMSDATLFEIITLGGGPQTGLLPEMPGAADLSETQAMALIRYIRSFCKNRSPQTLSTMRDPRRPESQHEHADPQ